MMTYLARPLRGLLLLLIGISLTVAGAWVLLAAAGVAPGGGLEFTGLMLRIAPMDGPLAAWAGAGLGLIAFGLIATLLAITPGTPAQPPRVTLVRPGEVDVALPGTTVTLSTRSLHALVAWLGGRVEGVRGVSPSVRLGPDGWNVHCRVDVWATSSLPAVADHLRHALHDDLLLHTGIAVDQLQLDFDYGQVRDAGVR